MSWTISYFSSELELEILSWPANLQARFIRLADLMQVYGPDLGMPNTRAFGGGLFEIRVKSSEGIGRVMYCTLVGKRVIMLHCFIKKTQKTPKKELETAFYRLRKVESDERSR